MKGVAVRCRVFVEILGLNEIDSKRNCLDVSPR